MHLPGAEWSMHMLGGASYYNQITGLLLDGFLPGRNKLAMWPGSSGQKSSRLSFAALVPERPAPPQRNMLCLGLGSIMNALAEKKTEHSRKNGGGDGPTGSAADSLDSGQGAPAPAPEETAPEETAPEETAPVRQRSDVPVSPLSMRPLSTVMAGNGVTVPLASSRPGSWGQTDRVAAVLGRGRCC